jgi:hypothetical protein
MYLAYFDESGDPGVVNSPTRFFVLSCVLVHESSWMTTLDGLVDLRSRLRRTYQIRTRPEIKSNDIRRGRGPLLHLRWSLEQRLRLFRALMIYQQRNLPAITVFAVAINKGRAMTNGWEPRTTAWDFTLQRVDRFCKPSGERAMLFPDEGNADFLRRLVRKKRRYGSVPKRWGGGSFMIPTERIVEDPNERRSHDSYFVQLADWNAYAAHRSSYVDPQPNVDPTLWDQLADRRLLAVNRLSGGPPGIKIYP